MFNSSLFNVTDNPGAGGVVVVRDETGDLLAQSAVFISGVLLSLGGCFAIVFANIRRSRCKFISCCGSKCTRENLGADGEIEV